MLSTLSAATLLPHGYCFQWRPELLWTHVASDAIIALAYFSIPITLVYFLRKRSGLKLWWVIALFAAFIVLCGFTHVFGIYTVWEPAYATSAGVKLATALVSLATAAAIVPLVPKALTLRTAEELEKANTSLQAEIERRQEAEQELAGSIRELKISNRELAQFASVASHDLQAPLRNIQSFSQLLRDTAESKLDDSEKECFDYIQKGANHMQTLVQDLLRFSKIGADNVQTERVEMENIIGHLRGILATDLHDAGATMRIEGELPILDVERALVAQVFQNLVGNAIKFRRPGVDPEVVISAMPEGDLCHIQIADNGIGIPEEQRERVFEIFSRLHGDGEYEGTGIGLAICQKIIERHEGSLWLESVEGQGTIFHFTLPLFQPEKNELPQEADIQLASAVA